MTLHTASAVRGATCASCQSVSGDRDHSVLREHTACQSQTKWQSGMGRKRPSRNLIELGCIARTWKGFDQGSTIVRRIFAGADQTMVEALFSPFPSGKARRTGSELGGGNGGAGGVRWMRAGKETRAEMARELGLSVATVTNARKRMVRKVLEGGAPRKRDWEFGGRNGSTGGVRRMSAVEVAHVATTDPKNVSEILGSSLILRPLSLSIVGPFHFHSPR